MTRPTDPLQFDAVRGGAAYSVLGETFETRRRAYQVSLWRHTFLGFRTSHAPTVRAPRPA